MIIFQNQWFIIDKIVLYWLHKSLKSGKGYSSLIYRRAHFWRTIFHAIKQIKKILSTSLFLPSRQLYWSDLIYDSFSQNTNFYKSLAGLQEHGQDNFKRNRTNLSILILFPELHHDYEHLVKICFSIFANQQNLDMTSKIFFS